ncbi:hypothetical protein LF95_20235 [Thalassospira sp. TSL5-1]|nr:hypothetical protein LF95_20235 [Thalassospira sp. TSL5-1]
MIALENPFCKLFVISLLVLAGALALVGFWIISRASRCVEDGLGDWPGLTGVPNYDNRSKTRRPHEPESFH